MYRKLNLLPSLLVVSCAISVLHAQERTDIYLQENLTSDLPALSEHTDANLMNPWGVSFPPTGPFWISDNRTGLSTLYNGAGRPFPLNSPIVVTIPPPRNGTGPAAPTGQVFHAGPGFEVQPGRPASFIFATEDGTISGWNPAADATHAILKVDNSASKAIYKGLALATANGVSRLYAANFFAGTIDMFDSNFAPVTLPTAFQDARVPSGYAPFNIQNIGGQLWVTYAKQDENKEDDVAGPGNGYISVFDFSGSLVQHFAEQGPLNAPWGMAMAPARFGAFSGALLVGNFGNGWINAFDPATGQFLGSMFASTGAPLRIDGLWALSFGNGANGGDTDQLYFTAGPNDEKDGLFGVIHPQHP
jgi:uncharacterized protein (TIGR03118 family)